VVERAADRAVDDLVIDFPHGGLADALITAAHSVDGVTVESGAVVEADVSGGPMTLAGQVTGNVTSTDRVELQSGARVVGNVKAARITIADGAHFKGNVDMDV